MSQSITSSSAEKLTEETMIKLAVCVGLAVFWVVFLWNFWDRGIYALGINAFVFLALFLGFFIWVLLKKGRYLKEDFLWIIPLSLVTVSFFLYDNPFVKVVTLFVWPVSFVVFYNYAFLNDRRERSWDLSFALHLFIERLVTILGNIGKSAILYLELIIPANDKYKKIIARKNIDRVCFIYDHRACRFDFKTTESLVKSGFWQLLVLTLLNIFIYFFTYKKTSLFVQKILLAFTTASLLLLVSAGHRMGLYVIFYGFGCRI